jgi:DNA-binding MarR family transcriptional regulator
MTEAARIEELSVALGRLSRALRRASAGEIPSARLSALATLAAAGPMRPGDLATRERVSAPTLSRMLAALTDAGLVARTADPADQRCSLLRVTAAGRRELARVRADRAAWLTERLSRLPAPERAAVLATAEAFDAMAGTTG